MGDNWERTCPFCGGDTGVGNCSHGGRAEAQRPKPVPFYERKIDLLVGKVADLEGENERLRKEVDRLDAWICGEPSP